MMEKTGVVYYYPALILSICIHYHVALSNNNITVCIITKVASMALII